MKSIFILYFTIFLAVGFSGCALFHPYRAPIEQGNILEAKDVNELHLGMSKTDVKKLLGDPVLKNTFNDNQLFYVYHLVTSYGKISEKRLVLTFNKNDALIKIDKNI